MGSCYNLEKDKNMLEVPGREEENCSLKRETIVNLSKIVYHPVYSEKEESYNIGYSGNMNVKYRLIKQ
jgi:hypothetical protein